MTYHIGGLNWICYLWSRDEAECVSVSLAARYHSDWDTQVDGFPKNQYLSGMPRLVVPCEATYAWRCQYRFQDIQAQTRIVIPVASRQTRNQSEGFVHSPHPPSQPHACVWFAAPATQQCKTKQYKQGVYGSLRPVNVWPWKYYLARHKVRLHGLTHQTMIMMIALSSPGAPTHTQVTLQAEPRAAYEMRWNIISSARTRTALRVYACIYYKAPRNRYVGSQSIDSKDGVYCMHWSSASLIEKVRMLKTH